MKLVIVYLAAIVAANLAVATFGPGSVIWVAFLFVGLDLTLRDALDDQWHGRPGPMAVLIAAGGVISYAVNRDAGIIAIASTVAFAAAAAADWLVYHILERYPRFSRVMGSNTVSAAVDSLLFPTIAFGAFLPLIVLGQFTAKVAGGAVWYGVLRALSQRSRPA